MAGRYTKYDAKVGRVVVRAVAKGLPLKFAAMKAGIGERTLHTWLADGKKADGNPAFQQFRQQVHGAFAKAVEVRIARIFKAGARDWRADAWWLERMYREYFGTDKGDVQTLLKMLEGGKANGHGSGPKAKGSSEAPA